MEVLIGCYKVIKELPSQFSYIRNCLAEQQSLGRRVHISIYTCPDEATLEYAYQVASKFGRLNHPHLETILDIAKEDLKLIIVHEFWDGEPFPDWLQKHKPLAPWQVEQLFYQMSVGACKLGEGEVLRGTLRFDSFFLAKTSDDRELLKIIAPTGDVETRSAADVAKCLAGLGLILATDSTDASSLTLDELDRKFPKLHHNWLKLVHNWANGRDLPENFEELINNVVVCSDSLSSRRDTWTLSNTAVHVPPPSKRLWPLVIGALIGVLLMSGLYLGYNYIYNAEEVYSGQVNKVKLAMTGAFSGPNKELGLSMRHGLEVAFEEFNGVKGPYVLELSTMDDSYEAQKAKQNGSQLLKDQEVAGFVGTIGTAAAADLRTMAVSDKKIFVGALSGGEFLQREAAGELVFNYRPRYYQEIEALLTYLIKEKGVNPQKIAIFYQNGPYGLSGLSGIYKSLKNHGLNNAKEQLVHASYRANTLDVSDAVETILSKRDDIELIMLVSTYDAAASLIKGVAAAGFYPKMAALSAVGADALAEQVRELNIEKLDLLLTQVVPDYKGQSKLAMAYRQAVEKYGPDHDPDGISFEGYINGRLLVAALSKIKESKKIDGPALSAALENGAGVDFGDASCQFNDKRHYCLDFVWLTAIEQNGKINWLSRLAL